MLSTLYAAVVRRRREYYAARPHLRRRLRNPVISIGNLAVGGRGKTPLSASLARLLLDMGERPAILSRGYGRESPEEGVVVVRDAAGIRADVHRAGDEPMMLARQLDGVRVLVSADRYLAGRLAEHHLGATVHVLDDGFQHLQLDRDVDLLVLSGEDFESGARTLPFGHLREPLDTMVAADAILVGNGEPCRMEDMPPVFRVRRTTGAPRGEGGSPVEGPFYVVAGIASPDRFVRDLRGAGRSVAGTRFFRDHHRYSARDVRDASAAARAAGAAAIVTTEKDFVRLLPFRPFPLPIAWVPLTMEPDPLPEFQSWLSRRLDETRDIIGD